ncbi:hypothetical protein IWX50DRAFT_617840 [Phyllosticta citricarpa]|uniref:Uncharacterized protein n=1 Tax=Phyllosticta citricarpa TaxID=55181 RepID=A0ABR1MDY1_9PEZI
MRKITDVGVPLAVAGVTPILWNTVKAFFISALICLSIPQNLQPFYEVVPNYMTGGVIVSVISQHYTHPGPYNNRSRVENATRSGFPTANPLALMLGWVLGNNYPDIFSDEAKCDRIPGHELGLQPFQLRAPQYASLCRPWMEMAWMCGFGLSSSTTHGNFINLSPHKYFSVDLLWFENPYPPLAMYWKHFVWFALTVSVDLNDLPKEEANFTLEDRHELLVLQRKNASFTIRNRHQHATIMSVSVTEGNWNVRLRVQKDFKYSIWQALAWNHTMCFQSIKSDESDDPTLCQKLGSRDETEFDDQLSLL